MLSNYLFAFVSIFVLLCTNLNAVDCPEIKLANSEMEKANVFYDKGKEQWKLNPSCALVLFDSAAYYGIKFNNHEIASNSYNAMGSIYRNMGKVDEAINAYSSAQEYAELAGNKRKIYIGMYNLSVLYSETYNNGKAFEIVKKMVEEIPKQNDEKLDKLYAVGLNVLGQEYKNKGEYQKALDSFHKSLKLCQKKGFQDITIPLYNNIALLYSTILDKETELKYYTYAKNAMESNHPIWGVVMNNIATILVEQNALDSAETIYRMVLENPNKTMLDSCVASIALGNVLNIKNDLASGKKYIDEGISIAYDIKDAHQQILGNLYLGRYWFKESKYNLAEIHFQRSLDTIYSKGAVQFLPEKGEVEYELLKLSLKVANEDTILSDLENYSETIKSILESKTLKVIEGENIKYETAKIQHENEILAIDNNIKTRNNIIFGVSAIAFLLGLSLYFVYNKKLQFENEILQKDSEKIRLLNQELTKKIQSYESVSKEEDILKLEKVADEVLKLPAKGGQIHYTSLNKILYVEWQKNYAVVNTINGDRIEVRRNVNDFFKEFLHPSLFAQVHKSFIVNRNHIKNIVGEKMTLNGIENKIPIGKKYKENL